MWVKTMVQFGNEKEEIEIFQKAYDQCLGLTCPVCMTECRGFAYLAMNLVKLRAEMIDEKDLEDDEMFAQMLMYMKVFFEERKEFIDRVIENYKKKGRFVEENEEEKLASSEPGVFVEEEEQNG